MLRMLLTREAILQSLRTLSYPPMRWYSKGNRPISLKETPDDAHLACNSHRHTSAPPSPPEVTSPELQHPRWRRTSRATLPSCSVGKGGNQRDKKTRLQCNGRGRRRNERKREREREGERREERFAREF